VTTPISALGGSDPYAAVAAASSTSSTAAPKDATADKLGSDAFLNLLVAQLKYQDPTNPADSTQFLAQTAQFQMVEKLEQLTKMTTEMNRIQNTVEANGLLGRQVTYNLGGEEKTGVVSSAHLTVDGATVRVGNQDVALDAVTQISAPSASTSLPASVPASPAT
jgi:flagellar basal-body rod modification protein FlgD